ncbi:hypothetical protein ABZ763_18800 [Streptomyces bacillaris]|uniref:hypothetical protein n=1 Tax=Streptomyces bacillaris TaxID=68179 RepID=UPI0034614A01
MGLDLHRRTLRRTKKEVNQGRSERRRVDPLITISHQGQGVLFFHITHDSTGNHVSKYRINDHDIQVGKNYPRTPNSDDQSGNCETNSSDTKGINIETLREGTEGDERDQTEKAREEPGDYGHGHPTQNNTAIFQLFTPKSSSLNWSRREGPAPPVTSHSVSSR